jgi:sec-independent protein translocase protein TatB
MFGIDLGHLIIIMIVAVIFLGPDKLPEMLVQMVKLFRSLKSTITEAKDSIQKEIDVHELKSTALGYKEQIEDMVKDTITPLHGEQNELGNLFSDLGKDFKDVEESIKSDNSVLPTEIVAKDKA